MKTFGQKTTMLDAEGLYPEQRVHVKVVSQNEKTGARIVQFQTERDGQICETLAMHEDTLRDLFHWLERP